MCHIRLVQLVAHTVKEAYEKKYYAMKWRHLEVTQLLLAPPHNPFKESLPSTPPP